MGIYSRNKGKKGEREVVLILHAIIARVCRAMIVDPIKLKRNTLQSDGGGTDIVGLDWLALEVKRQETLRVNQWWAQACGQANAWQVIVLLWRRNNERWHARVRDARGEKEYTFEEFQEWFERHLVAHILDELERDG